MVYWFFLFGLVRSHNIRKWKLLFLKKRLTTSDFDVFLLLLQCVDGCEMREIFSGFEQVLIRLDSLNSWKFRVGDVVKKLIFLISWILRVHI